MWEVKHKTGKHQTKTQSHDTKIQEQLEKYNHYGRKKLLIADPSKMCLQNEMC